MPMGYSLVLVFRRSGIALVAMLPIILPFTVGVAVIKWPHATYERMYAFLHRHFLH